MTLVKYNNRGNTLDNLFNDLLENSFFRPFVDRKEYGNSIPMANIQENENFYVIEMAIPGSEKKDIEVNLNDNILSISSKKDDDQMNNFKMREFNYRSFSRSFKMPKEINAEKIEATYKNGILSMTIPKMHEDQSASKRSIKIS